MLKKRMIALFAVSALIVSGQAAFMGASHAAPRTVTVWSPFSGDGLAIWDAAIARFEKTHPAINVVSVGSVDMAKSLAAINAGTGPDISVANGAGNVGWFCSTGAWQNLNKNIASKTVGLDVKSIFPASVLSSTISVGNRCALPFAAEVVGMYYNKDMLAKAGFTKPPTTVEELTAYSKKLTTFDSAGNIKTAGFVPWVGYNNPYGFGAQDLGFMFGAHWYSPNGAPAFGTDPLWAKAFNWQKTFITDVFGGGNFTLGKSRLLKFTAGAGDEWGGDSDFMTGKTAMWIVAQWMAGAYCDNTGNWVLNPCNHPYINFGVAPTPVLAAMKSTNYGAGRFSAQPMGISKGSKNPTDAWEVLKFLATDTKLQIDYSNWGTSIPATKAALASKDLVYPAVYKTFFDIVAHPRSGYHPLMPTGEHLDEVELDDLMAGWQAGSVTNLSDALTSAGANVAKIIERQGK